MYDIDKEFESIVEKTDKWRKLFKESKRYDLLEEEQQVVSDDIIESFISYMFHYEGQSPEDWTVAGLKSCCLEILPRKISAGADYYTHIVKVLEAFFLFLDDN